MALLKNLCKRFEIRGSAPCHRQACTRRPPPLPLPLSLAPAPSQQQHREGVRRCGGTSWPVFVSQREGRGAKEEEATATEPRPKGNPGRALGGVHLQPVGVFRSCFACRNGCPRQGSLVPTSFGRVELNDESFDGPAGQALKGLEDFSHVWIVWSFHKHR